jgi:hypothetical protein
MPRRKIMPRQKKVCRVCLSADMMNLIMHEFVNSILWYNRVRQSKTRLQLLALCTTKEEFPLARYQMMRLYFFFHCAWHRPFSQTFYALDNMTCWHVKTKAMFTFQKKQRMSVLFCNDTVSCLVGFIIQCVETGILEYLSVTRAEEGVLKHCIVCPVFVSI